MKQKEISLNSLLIDSDHFLLTDEEIGDNHVATSIDTPMTVSYTHLRAHETLS
jgi:GTP cyclohydrolase I